MLEPLIMKQIIMPMVQLLQYWLLLVGWLVVFNVPSTARSFRDGTPIYCPLRRTWSSINTPFRPGIEPRAVAWQSITLPLRYASSTLTIVSHCWSWTRLFDLCQVLAWSSPLITGLTDSLRPKKKNLSVSDFLPTLPNYMLFKTFFKGFRNFRKNSTKTYVF